MFIDGGADGELGHLQGHQYDTFNITNKDLAGHIQCTARTSFDNISCGVARGCLHRDDFVRVCAHDGRKELQGESPAVDEPVSVDAREEASKVLIVYTWCRKVVEIGVFEELDEIKDISFCQVVGESLW